jgi:mannose-6-phosphate isomerase
MLQASDEAISKTTTALLKVPRESFGKEGYIPDMIPRLVQQYDKTDPGIVVALITMNYMTLKPGQCIYIPADGIHAYLSGTIIECMARSNNVLNTGFCPRGDRNSADLFCSNLTFTPHAADEAILGVQKFEGSRNEKTGLYAPPLSEFNVLATKLGDGEKETIEALGGPSIFICTKGEGELEADGKRYEVKEGYIFFVGVDTEMEFVAKEEMQVFTAFAE